MLRVYHYSALCDMVHHYIFLSVACYGGHSCLLGTDFNHALLPSDLASDTRAGAMCFINSKLYETQQNTQLQLGQYNLNLPEIHNVSFSESLCAFAPSVQIRSCRTATLLIRSSVQFAAPSNLLVITASERKCAE
jgi:hypothetical protein